MQVHSPEEGLKTVIIEAEEVAAQTLTSLLEELYPDITVLATLQSVGDSLEWLSTHAAPDLLFMDTHLSDNSSFAIFDKTPVTCPVIFTVTYDKYVLRAFEANSIAYLLKPISRSDLQQAIEKFRNLSGAKVIDSSVLSSFLESIRKERVAHKSSFMLVPDKDKQVPFAIKDVACIYLDAKMVVALTYDKRRYYLTSTLEELTLQLDSRDFYRANRQYIIARAAVRGFRVWPGDKLAVNLIMSVPDKIYVSRTRAKEFKEWLAK
jgi:two-component system LytT family response regulator